MTPGIDKLDGLVKVVNGNDWQYRCENFSIGTTVRRNPAITRPSYALAHQGIVRADVPDDRGGDVFRLTVGFPTENDSTPSVIQQFLDAVKASVVWQTSDNSGFGSSIRIKFPIPEQKREVRPRIE